MRTIQTLHEQFGSDGLNPNRKRCVAIPPGVANKSIPIGPNLLMLACEWVSLGRVEKQTLGSLPHDCAPTIPEPQTKKTTGQQQNLFSFLFRKGRLFLPGICAKQSVWTLVHLIGQMGHFSSQIFQAFGPLVERCHFGPGNLWSLDTLDQ